MSALPATQRAKLAKVLALLDSPREGERDAAALAAARLVKTAGLSWAQILAAPPVKREPGYGTWRTTCTELQKRPGDLRPWERKFVADLPAFPRISSKQRYILDEIRDRVLKRDAP
jgi:hypothetical protein